MELLFTTGPVVINIGVQGFAESILEQEIPVVQVDWSPPAEVEQDIADLLDKLI
jgi:hypothetical protein